MVEVLFFVTMRFGHVFGEHRGLDARLTVIFTHHHLAQL